MEINIVVEFIFDHSFSFYLDEKKIIENISKVNAARKEIEDSKENSNNNTNNIGDEVI